MSIFTTVLSASHGIYTTGSFESSKPDGTADVRLVRDSTNIVDGEKLGKISFLAYDGSPGDLPLSGAFIEAQAVNTWSTQYRQATDLRIGVQTHENNIDRTLTPAMVISGSDASVGFEVGIRPARVQVGVSTDNNLADQGDGLLRVSSKLNDTGIDIDPDSGAGRYGFIRFYNNGVYASSTPAIFVESNPSSNANKFNIGRWFNNGDHASALTINNNANSVRIGGGGHTDSNDTNAALVVTGSTSFRKSTLRIASRHQTRETSNAPGICLDFKAGSSNNQGAWHIISGKDLVQGAAMVPLRISAAGPGSSNAAGLTAAMTFAKGGADARVGIGGGNTSWPSTPYPRSMDPTGSFHIENINAQTLQLTSDLDKSTLLLGNSNNSNAPVFAELSFDVSTELNKEKRTAAISVVRDPTNANTDIHKGKLHVRMDDGSGNKDSTRTRLRLDDQGGMLIFSGTHVQQGGGYPNVRDENMVVGDDVPSGSITLIAQGGLTNSKPEVIPTLNFMLYTGTTDSDISRAIEAGDTLGRMQWWSNDNELTVESEKVAAYIEVTAPEDHDNTKKSPGEMSFYVRNTGAPHPEESIRLSTNGDLRAYKDIHALGGNIKDLTGDAAISLPGNGKVELSNSYSGATAAGLSVDNKNTSLNSGGFVEVSKTINGIGVGETLGGVLFAGADTGVSSTPNASAKILAKTVEAWTHNSAQGTEIQFHTTEIGGASAELTAQISRSGITGSVGGLKLMAGNIELPDVPEVIRGGQNVKPAILLDAGNTDTSIFRVDTGGSSEDHGFTLVYSGSGSGINNKLELWADDSATGVNQQKITYSIDNAANMHIHQALLGTDPDDTDVDPANPALVIAGRREARNAFCALTKADAATNGVKQLIPLNNLGTGEADFTSVDQQPQQTKYAFVAPSDGYIESISFLSDHMWGIANVISNKHTISLRKQSSTSTADLSTLSDFITLEFWYGYATTPLVISQAGKVSHMDTASRSSASFSAGDKIYLMFEGYAGDTQYRDVTGTLSSAMAYININVNFVFDDRNLDT